MNRFAKLAIALVALCVIAVIATPNLLSTAYVKERISDQLSEMTGRRVALNGSSSVSLSPYLGVSYKDVTIGDTGSGKPIVVMDRLQARLGLMSALWGDAQFTELQFVRPRFNLRVDASGDPNWSLNKGPLAERLKLQLDETPESLKLGTLVIEDGILKLENELSRTTTEVTAINGKLVWKEITAAGEAALSAVWRGEVVSLDVSAGSPYDLLREGASKFSATIKAKPLTLVFDGSLDSAKRVAIGDVSTVSPSLRRLAEWFGRPVAAAEGLSAVSVSGPVTASLKKIEFSDAKVEIGDHVGSGRLQIEEEDSGEPSISGTLAFNTLSLPSLNDLKSAGSETTENKTELNFTFLKGFTLDVRLSADEATSPPLQMSNLAASAIIRDGKASFDIGQAETLGGTIAGSVSMRAENEGATLSSDLALTDVDLEMLADLYSKDGVSLLGKGNAEFKLKSTGTSPANLLVRLNGEGSITGRDGVVSGVDLSAIHKAAIEGGDPVYRNLAGKTDYKSLKIIFFVANGTAFLRGSELLNDTILVSIGGRSDLAARSLALRGRIKGLANDGNPDEKTVLPFFVGGTTGSPLLVPLPGTINPSGPPETQKKTMTSQ